MVKRQMKRWLIVTQYYPPEVGAPQIRLAALARELKRHGMDVRVLTAIPNYPTGTIFPDYRRGEKRREILDGIPVRRAWIYPATGKSPLKRLANYFSFTCSALVSALTGRRPDVIFLESQPLSLGIVGIAMKWLRRVPYIYNVPDLQVDVAKQMHFVRNPWFLALASAVEDLFLRQSWKVSTVTHKFVEHFETRGLPREQISFLPNGADTDFLRPRPQDPELLDRWRLGGKKVFLYVGTHAYYHGLDTLIEAASILRDRLDLAFLLVGDGPERQRLISMAADRRLTNVSFGESPYLEMDRLYSIAYASVATLRNIEVARQMRLSKIFPSLSCGVPVIYSGMGEAAELIETHDVGRAVAPEDPQLLAQAITDLAANEPLRNQQGMAGRALVEREYSWTTIVNRWLGELGID
jgi:colanic acid biosynthesis glycosyl transferase WcaI